MQLTEIHIYPVKSLGGISLSEARLSSKGLDMDRRWMLVSEGGKFLTQRNLPQLALFRTHLHDSHLTISLGEDKAVVPLGPGQGPLTTTEVWGTPVKVREVHAEISQWFSRHLGMNCVFTVFPEEQHRPINPTWQKHHEEVSLADGYPYLVIGEASLNDLNSRLAHPIPMNRFRPNLVFTGGSPYEEDEWFEFTIGTAQFRGLKPCGRCQVPGINQETGEKSDEPLRTLSKYRRAENEVNFGLHAVGAVEGKVRVGDEIQILSRKAPFEVKIL
jgi:uncharacterized protein